VGKKKELEKERGRMEAEADSSRECAVIRRRSLELGRGGRRRRRR
jgi:hypothetical protein